MPAGLHLSVLSFFLSVHRSELVAQLAEQQPVPQKALWFRAAAGGAAVSGHSQGFVWPTLVSRGAWRGAKGWGVGHVYFSFSRKLPNYFPGGWPFQR